MTSYVEAAATIRDMARIKRPEGLGGVRERLFDALGRLPLAIEGYAKYSKSSISPDVWAHEEARNLYLTGLKAVELQGRDHPENQVVELVCAHGVVAETQTLLDLAARGRPLTGLTE